MVVLAVSGDEGDGYRCFANEDVGEAPVGIVTAIMRRDYEGLRTIIGQADTEAVSVLLAAFLADVLRDVSQQFPRAGDPESVLAIKNRPSGRGEEIW